LISIPAWIPDQVRDDNAGEVSQFNAEDEGADPTLMEAIKDIRTTMAVRMSLRILLSFFG
jgi:hypothetical protein